MREVGEQPVCGGGPHDHHRCLGCDLNALGDRAVLHSHRGIERAEQQIDHVSGLLAAHLLQQPAELVENDERASSLNDLPRTVFVWLPSNVSDCGHEPLAAAASVHDGELLRLAAVRRAWSERLDDDVFAIVEGRAFSPLGRFAKEECVDDWRNGSRAPSQRDASSHQG